MRAKRRGFRGAEAVALSLLLLLPTVSFAQEVALPDPVEPPKAAAGAPEIALDGSPDIDLANIVTSAAKTVTSVQEAPAIVTIITDGEIKRRGFRFLSEALATVPGWLDTAQTTYSALSVPMVRGVQTLLLLRDGVSMFDPWSNLPWTSRTQPLESLKRIEVVTGPGGVLWGANSFLGVVNLIGKDAEDVNGLELSAGYGDGRGNVQDFKAYLLFGKTFLNGRLKLFQHLSYETFIGDVYTLPETVLTSAPPNPPSAAQFGPIVSPFPPRSWEVIVDGKITFGPITLSYMLPFGDNYQAIGAAGSPTSGNAYTVYDRSAVLEYKDRFLRDKLQLSVKGYFTQFERSASLLGLPPSAVFPAYTNPDGSMNPGGFRLDFNHGAFIYRSGATVDLSAELPKNFRLLGGGEAFYEAIAGSIVSFSSPAAAHLALLCPLEADGTRVPDCPHQFVNDTSRIVGAVYADLQWRPARPLMLDGGVRLQEGFGARPYGFTPLYSAALVWSFLPDFHLKLNYATGFRPPVFNATDSAPGTLQYVANPNLKTESSQAIQGEVNARLLRNVGYVRELEVRLDYSYTVLNDLILISGNFYENSGSRAIHSAEGYAHLYLTGDHSLQASYTYLNATSNVYGALRNTPHQWFSIGAVLNLVANLLDVNVNLNVLGSFDDPTHYPGAASSVPGAITTGRLSDIALDPLAPVALLQLGARVRFLRDQLSASAQLYNVLDQHYYLPNADYNLVPQLPPRAIPGPGFSFFATLTYHPRF